VRVMSAFFNIMCGSYYFMGGLGRQAPGGSFVFLIGKGDVSRLFGERGTGVKAGGTRCP